MNDEALGRYISALENLTPKDVVSQLAPVTTDDIHFKDPFNDIVGRERMATVFDDMFENLDNVKFTVQESATTGARGFLLWEMASTSKRDGTDFPIVGMSIVRIAEDGRIEEHIDHWDAGAQLYERLPVIGWILRKIKAKLAV